jgi:hypothetical protein
MLRVSGRHLRQFGAPITTLLLLASVTAYGQSLGDVARENREKKVEAAATAPLKVITDSDLATDKQGPEETDVSAKPQTASPGKTRADRTTVARPVDRRAAEQWRRQILDQKRTVATLEKRLARLQASISDIDASAISRGEIFTRTQAWEQQRLAQAREQLEEQRAKLLDMQEEARQAGMSPPVYDP